MRSRLAIIALALGAASCGPSEAQSDATNVVQQRDRVIARQEERIAQLEAALRASQPDLQAAYWAGQLEQQFKPDSDSVVSMFRGNDEVSFAALLSAYNAYVHRDRMNPAEAYLKAVAGYGPKGHPETSRVRRYRLQQLAERKAAAGH